MSIYVTINTSIFTKKITIVEKVKGEEERGRDYKQFEIIDNGDQEAKSPQKEETKTRKT